MPDIAKSHALNLRSSAVFIISILLQVLFVYTALNKLSDFQKFRVELGQSPLLAPFTLAVAIATPTLEIITALLLFFHSSRRLGLVLSFGLMVLFTTYVYVIMHYASNVPCSCGGILNNMGWKEHLVFNAFFTVVALTGTILSIPRLSFRTSLHIGFALVAPVALVLGLLFYDQDRHNALNGFRRSFKENVLTSPSVRKLRGNAWYVAGLTDDTIYLGNRLFSGTIMAWPYNLDSSRTIKLDLPDSVKFAWKASRIYADQLGYFLAERVAPMIWRFDLNGNSPARVRMAPSLHFDRMILSDSGFVFRMYDWSLRRYILAAADGEQHVFKDTNLLTPQQDGAFSTDGMLTGDKSNGRYMYLYVYRNEILSFDHHIGSVQRGRTIDTTSWAKIQLEEIKSEKEIKMSAPPVKVNRLVCADGGRLFVHSGLRADNEDGRIASITMAIDVYSSDSLRYLYSFYVPEHEKKGIREMAVKGNKMILLRGRYLTVYELDLP